MLRIRLQRVGRKGEPAFRLVLTDSQNSTKSGRFKEILGSYDPRKTTDILDAEKIKYWISKGAQPTDTVYNLLITHGVIEGKKRNVLPKKTPPAPTEQNDQAPSSPSTSSGSDDNDQTSTNEEIPKVEEKNTSVETEVDNEEKVEEAPAEESAPVEENQAE